MASPSLSIFNTGVEHFLFFVLAKVQYQCQDVNIADQLNRLKVDQEQQNR